MYMVDHVSARFLHRLSLMQRRILIVEPYQAIRELLAASLLRAGHAVEAVENGNEALAAMERGHFRCVIVGSPVVVRTHGASMLLLEYIERHCPHWNPRLLVVTTQVEPGDITDLSRRLGVCAVLAKPFEAEDLLDAVDGCLDGCHGPTRWIGMAEHATA